MSRQLYLGTQLRPAERRVDQQVTTPTVVTEIFNRESESVDLDAVESLQSGERHLLIGRSEVEVGRERPALPALNFRSAVPPLKTRPRANSPAL